MGNRPCIERFDRTEWSEIQVVNQIQSNNLIKRLWLYNLYILLYHCHFVIIAHCHSLYSRFTIWVSQLIEGPLNVFKLINTGICICIFNTISFSMKVRCLYFTEKNTSAVAVARHHCATNQKSILATLMLKWESNG